VKRLEVQLTLRAKNQITLPDPVARHLGARPGDRLLITVQEDQPDTAVVRLLRRSYAGVGGRALAPHVEGAAGD
jgi:bifunctional DNA-binding transcriptional regulator/antitoxin component of YhaV-PrlF toxin-antitoxin module